MDGWDWNLCVGLRIEHLQCNNNWVELETVRMLVENEATFISALKADLNKPVQETIMAEIDFLRYFLFITSLKDMHSPHFVVEI